MQWQPSQIPLGVMETLRAPGTQQSHGNTCQEPQKSLQDADGVESLI